MSICTGLRYNAAFHNSIFEAKINFEKYGDRRLPAIAGIKIVLNSVNKKSSQIAFQKPIQKRDRKKKPRCHIFYKELPSYTGYCSLLRLVASG